MIGKGWLTDRVIRRGRDHSGRRRGGRGVRGQRVHQRVDELQGAAGEDQVLVVCDGVADGPVQAPDLALQLHGLEAAGGGVAHAVPPGEHHGAGRRVTPPVRLQEQRVPAATTNTTVSHHMVN